MNKWLIAAVLFSPSFVVAQSQIQEGIDGGLLLAATVVPRQWVDTIAAQCAEKSPSTREQGARAIAVWLRNNQSDLEAIEELLLRFRRSLALDVGPEKTEELMSSWTNDVRKMTTNEVESVISRVLHTYPPEEMHIGCTRLFGGVEKGTWDIKNNQPTAYKLVQEHRAQR